MGRIGRWLMALKIGYDAFLRALPGPGDSGPRDPFAAQRARYNYLWHYYQNTAFDDLALWSGYKARNRLYRHIRSVYNPARRLVDFYAGTVYQGVLTTDARRLPGGVQTAIPFAEDTDPALLAAVGQLWRWSNWQSNMGVMVRYGAALGDCLVDIVDDVQNRKVYFDVLWPGWVADLELDSMGNVKRRAIEYIVDPGEPGQGRYTYRHEIDGDEIRTYRNGELYDYDGAGAVQPNPYGFVPSVWIRHTNVGGDHGDPALRNLGKWDELNALAAHALDQVHMLLATPPLISGNGVSIVGGRPQKDAATVELDDPSAGRERLRLIRGDAGSDIKHLHLDAGQTLEHIDRLIKEVEADHPEITMYNQLREMTQVTGPGADRLFGDVASLVLAARAEYDTQSVKLFQMGTAIAGWRLARGDWGETDRQRAVFAGYDLESYGRGDLDLEILPRPLVPVSPTEQIALERQRLGLESDRMALTAPSATQGIIERLNEMAAAE